MASDFEKEIKQRDPLEPAHRADGSKTAVGIIAMIVVTALIVIVGGILVIAM